MPQYAAGDRVLVKTYTQRELPCTVVTDTGGPQVLVSHAPAGDEPVVAVWPVPRQRVRAAPLTAPAS